MRRVRHAALLVCAAMVALAQAPVGQAMDAQAMVGQQAPGRVVVLGFDGADPARIRDYIDAGHLEHLARLDRAHGLRTLATTTPAQSPVSWSSLITGVDPGETGVFGFVRLEAGPSLALTTTEWRPMDMLSAWARWAIALGVALVGGLALVGLARVCGARRMASIAVGLAGGLGAGALGAHLLFGLLPASGRALHNTRGGTPFYAHAASQGVASVALSAPMDAPPPRVDGLRVLCGLGMPDVAETTGRWAVFTTEPIVVEGGDGRVVLLDGAGPDYRSTLEGPVDPFVDEALAALDRRPADDFASGAARAKARADLEARLRVTVPVTFGWRGGSDRVRITVDGTSVDVRAGQWSPLIPVDFAVNWIVRTRALVRFRVERAGRTLRVYQEPIGVDPRVPNARMPVSHPPAFAGELAAAVGLFETTGWACATNATRDDMIDEAAFIEDVHSVIERRAAMVAATMTRDDWRLLFATFTGVDRIQHLLGRHLDPTHPRHDPAEAAAGRRRILDAYKAIDAIVGRVAAALGPTDRLLIVSDHGFAAYGWSLNLNDWLVRHGYLVLRDRGASGFAAIDWTATRAFACGLGQIYVNRSDAPHGRGTVPPAEAPAIAREIAAKLVRLTHRGRTVVPAVALGDDVFAGTHRVRAPDVVPGLAPGYRVGPATVFGGTAGRIFEPNDDRWSGDHCSVDPNRVPGVLLVNAPLVDRAARVTDIAPTVYDALGVAPPPGLAGASLLRR